MHFLRNLPLHLPLDHDVHFLDCCCFDTCACRHNLDRRHGVSVICHGPAPKEERDACGVHSCFPNFGSPVSINCLGGDRLAPGDRTGASVATKCRSRKSCRLAPGCSREAGTRRLPALLQLHARPVFWTHVRSNQRGAASFTNGMAAGDFASRAVAPPPITARCCGSGRRSCGSRALLAGWSCCVLGQPVFAVCSMVPPCRR